VALHDFDTDAVAVLLLVREYVEVSEGVLLEVGVFEAVLENVGVRVDEQLIPIAGTVSLQVVVPETTEPPLGHEYVVFKVALT
jgi:hypothetical protein